MSPRFRFPAVFHRITVGLCAGLMLLAALPTAASEARFAFSVNDLDASLASYRVDPQTGFLRFLRYYPLGKSTPTVVVDPSGQFVLATSQSVDRLFVFRLDRRTGELRAVEGSPFATGGRSPFQVVFHPNGRILYMAHRFAGVGAYLFDVMTGAITALEGSPYRAGERTRSLVVHPSGRLLYAMNAHSNDISAYRIDPRTGVLTALPGFPVTVGEMGQIDYLAQEIQDVPDTAGGLPYHMSSDPAGHFLFVTNAASANISVFRIDAQSGALKEVAGSPFFTGFNPYSSTVDPSGNRLYVTRPRDDVIAVFDIDAETGRLREVPGSPFASGGDKPAYVTFTQDGRRAYVNNMESNDIVQMAVDRTTGALSVVEAVKTRSAPWAFTLASGEPPAPRQERLYASRLRGEKGELTILSETLKPLASAASGGRAMAALVRPGEAYAYTANVDDGTVTTFVIDASGPGLKAAGEVVTGQHPSALATDVNGWYLYVPNRDDDTLSVYYIDPDTGEPKPVRGSPVKAGDEPVAVTLDPASRYAFVVNRGSNNVSVYRYRTNVTPLYFESLRHGSPFATGRLPEDLAVDPTGRYAYVANAGDDTISAYRIHHLTGALSALPGSPFKAGRHPLALAAHPDGRHLLVANRDSRDIRLYRIEKQLGAIAPFGKPLKLPLTPKGLWLSVSGDKGYVLSADGRYLLRFAFDAASGGMRLLDNRRLAIPVTDLVLLSRP